MLRTLSGPLGLALAGVLSACLAGCDVASVDATPPAPAPPPVVEDPEPPTEIIEGLADLPPQGKVRVLGMVMGRNDPQAPPRPFNTGLVVIVPRAKFDEVRRNANGPFKAMLVLGDSYPLPPELDGSPDCWTIPVRTDGTYRATVPPGEYAFLLGDLLDNKPSGTDGVWIEKSFLHTVTDEPLQTVVPVLTKSTREMELLQ